MPATCSLVGSRAVNLPGSSSPSTASVSITLTDSVGTDEILFLSYGPLSADSVSDSKGNDWTGTSWIRPTTPLVAGDTVTLQITIVAISSQGFVASLLKITGLSNPTLIAGSGVSGQFLTSPQYASTPNVTPATGKIAVLLGVGAIDAAGGSGTAAGGSINPVVAGWTNVSGLSAGVGGSTGFFANSSTLQAQYYQVVDPTTGASYYFDANLTGPANTNGNWRIGVAYFLGDGPNTSVTDISQARANNTGLLLVSHIDANGVIATNRYDSSLPPALAATVTHETSQGSGVSLVALGGNSFELLYAHNGTIKRRKTRDGGRTWSVATTIASGYQDVCHLIDTSTGLALAALWKESTNEWYLAIGQRPSGTGDHTYTVVGLLVGSAKRGASLIRTAGRRYEFAYRTTSDVLTIIRCKAKNASSVGTWS